MDNLKQITETSYLNAINAPQYRRIMRIFYEENEKMRFQLYKGDVFERLRNYTEGQNYTIEQLKTDLDKLVEWKNLTPIQDPKRVYTIADYKNQQFRYSMTAVALEIERMADNLQHLFLDKGNLSTNRLLRMNDYLIKLKNVNDTEEKQAYEYWISIQEDFKRLNQDYQNYLREFYSGRTEKIMKSVAFILHKDNFIRYLKEFISELREYAAQVETTLSSFDEQSQKLLLHFIIRKELQIPQSFMEDEQEREMYIEQKIFGQWNTLKSWFISNQTKESEYSRILDITNNIIHRIIQNAVLIMQLQNWGISRKKDYEKLITMFMNCKNIEEAHCLSAHAFGVENVYHFQSEQERSTDSINSSTYEEEAMTFLLESHGRQYRPRIDKTGFESKALEKQMQRMDYLQQIEEEKKVIMAYIQHNQIDVSKIKDVVPVTMRRTLLKWITQANNRNTKKGSTEYGQEYTLIRKEGNSVLHCEDGDLCLPNFILKFKEEEYE